MSFQKQSKVLSVLQPDLLPVEELVQIIESRCCRAENLRLMPKEGLVELFRRVVLPLPQRLYRTNRRGKMLTARRARAGLGSDRKEEGSLPGSNGRLKPLADICDSHSLRASCGRNGETSWDHSGGTGDVPAKDGGRLCSGEGGKEDHQEDSKTSGRRITLKRPSSGAEKPSSVTPLPTDNKRQRTTIKWP